MSLETTVVRALAKDCDPKLPPSLAEVNHHTLNAVISMLWSMGGRGGNQAIILHINYNALLLLLGQLVLVKNTERTTGSAWWLSINHILLKMPPFVLTPEDLWIWV